jgi:hypothetical protein
MPLKRKYVDDAAQHSGDDTSDGGSDVSGSESDDSMVCGDDEVEFEEGGGKEDFNHREVTEKTLKKHRRKMQKARDARALAEMAQSLSETAKHADKSFRESMQKRKEDDDDRDAMGHAAPSTKSMPSRHKQSARLGAAELKDDDDTEPRSNTTRETALTKDVKLASNKFLHESSIPPKPQSMGLGGTFSSKKVISSKKINFRMIFTNGSMFYKFLLPIASAVHELRMNLVATPDFTGIRLEAHDTYLTLANKSRYECDIEAGFAADGAPLAPEDLTGLSFCVPAASFMQTLGCATLKDTVLTITKYSDAPDKVTFESVTNENDVQTVYSCDLLAESRLESLKGMQFNLGYHVNIYLKTLKEQTVNAKKCGASTIFFALYQAEDVDDTDVVHSRLSVGFKGTVTSGCHDFYQSARKIEREEENGSKIIEWEPLASLKSAKRQGIQMKQCSYNEYDNSKLRLFLNHMVSHNPAAHLIYAISLLTWMPFTPPSHRILNGS